MESQSCEFTSASIPLEVRRSRAQAGGRPGPWVSDLIIIGRPISPASIRCMAATNSGEKRRMKPICRTTPARLVPSMIASHSARFSAIGFSRKTCLPCAAAVSASSRWVKVGVVMITASNATLSSASSREANRASMPNSSPVAARISATGSTSATIFAPGTRASAREWFLPTRPAPIMQMRTGAFSIDFSIGDYRMPADISPAEKRLTADVGAGLPVSE